MDIRKELVNAIKEEIVGPVKYPKYKDETTGEELLLRSVHGTPKSRYGAGMLYPKTTENSEIINSEENAHDADPSENNSTELSGNVRGKAKGEDLDYQEPVGLANQFLPSAMGFTIQFNKNNALSEIELEFSSAFYKKGNDQISKKRVNKEGRIENVSKNGETILTDYWIRIPFKIDKKDYDIYSLFTNGVKVKKEILAYTETGDPWLSLNIYNRSVSNDDLLTYTFVLVNEVVATGDKRVDDKYILYQNELILRTSNINLIAPYKERSRVSDTEEEIELNLLYKNKRIFGIGHGISVEWKSKKVEENEKVTEIKTSVIPTYEIPQIAPTSLVTLSMYDLSDFGDWDDAILSLKELMLKYEEWIYGISAEAKNLHKSYQPAANNSILKCLKTLERIKRGVDYLIKEDESSDLVRSFRWMNRAMLWQQQRSGTPQRLWKRSRNKTNQPIDILDPIEPTNKQEFNSLEVFKESERWGKWRPFQLAFVLMNIESIVNPESKEREIVDLIWFPTGGGKTEAYLGLSALTIFYRRLIGEKEFKHEKYAGTTILMRYTLRLLTTQQYERAASLICACELIRMEEERNGNFELGDEEISIGLWVGGSSTPNANKTLGKSIGALEQFNKLNDHKLFKQAPYNFVVMKCPCCSAQIGKISNAIPTDKLKVKGLRKVDGNNATIKFSCENDICEFHDRDLPLFVIDEEIYSASPTLLLGTVDKFAMLPWKPESGTLFGFRVKDGKRYRIKPPELIIQDELHLISGPLGSMVGIYEIMVQTLCNDYGIMSAPFIKSEALSVPPKIVASSATISRAKEQVKALYGKNEEQLHIFPSQGIEFGNTWFSKEKEVNSEYPGRIYAGILASGYPSAQTAIVRSYASVLQKVKQEGQNFENINYYWTLLGYFNSIRELGGAMSLVHGDIRERLNQIQNRELVPYGEPNNFRRNIYKIQELTSRISSDKIPDTLKDLERNFNLNNPIREQALDICLATNMVATGVDISRLGLMFIHGQPKTTAEYIQASSRVGRRAPEGPGLIFTLYSPSKPRDKSQYEQFQGYHSRIYSNVEPTSVTPFSINVRERALHAILIGLIRHLSSDIEGILTKPETQGIEFNELKSIVTDLIIQRASIVNPEEVESTKTLCEKRFHFWENTGYQSYGDAGNYGIKFKDVHPLMYANSAEIKKEIRDKSLATPTSMRGVDTESQIEIISI